MKFWICPKCNAVNEEKVDACNNCNMPALAILALPTLQWLEFDSIEALDKWIALVQKNMGSKVWRRKRSDGRP